MFRVAMVAAAFATGALSACSSPLNCPAVGAISGVNFGLSRITPAQGHFVVHACVESRCVDQQVDRSVTDRVLVKDEDLRSAGPVKVMLVVRKPNLALVFRSLTPTVTLRKVQPNGTKCPPTAWYRNVSAVPGGRLVGAP